MSEASTGPAQLLGFFRARPPVARQAGRTTPSEGKRASGIRRLALLAGIFWTVVIVAYATGFVSVAADRQNTGVVLLDILFFAIALILPLVAIGLSAWFAGELHRTQEMVAHLTDRISPLAGELDATRQALKDQGSVSQEYLDNALSNVRPAQVDFSADIIAIGASQAKLQSTLDALLSGIAQDAPPASATPVQEERRETELQPVPAPEPPVADPMPLLPDASDTPPPSWSDLVRALDFPIDDQDFEGFRALRAVLGYRPLARMLQAAEDVLTLLSQEGIYMDDLAMDTGSPEAWRRFISGERGTGVSGVGRIQDESALETTRDLIRSDPIFRDTALFFQRRFDRVLTEFAADVSNDEILQITNTRSGRAFVLLARLSGSFGQD